MKMIKNKTKIEEVKAALQAFGYPKTDLIELEAIDEIRCKVFTAGISSWGFMISTVTHLLIEG